MMSVAVMCAKSPFKKLPKFFAPPLRCFSSFLLFARAAGKIWRLRRHLWALRAHSALRALLFSFWGSTK